MSVLRITDPNFSINGTQSGNGNLQTSGDIVNSTIHQDSRTYTSDSPDVLRAQIDVMDARIKEKDAQIKEKDAQIKEKDAQIKEKDAQISRLLTIIDRLSSAPVTDELRDTLVAKDAEIDRLKRIIEMGDGDSDKDGAM